MERLAYGEVVPIPTLPLPLTLATTNAGVEEPWLETLNAYWNTLPISIARRAVGDDEAMPTAPLFVTMKFEAVEEPIKNAGDVELLLFIDNRPNGDVEPTPTVPVFVIANSVDCAPDALVEPTAKRVEKMLVEAAWMENSEKSGEVEPRVEVVEVAVEVPTPTAPV